MEILIVIGGLAAVGVLANAVGSNSRDMEAALRDEHTPVRADAFLTERPDKRDWR